MQCTLIITACLYEWACTSFKPEAHATRAALRRESSNMQHVLLRRESYNMQHVPSIMSPPTCNTCYSVASLTTCNTCPPS